MKNKAMLLMLEAEMRPFTKHDYTAFPGVESEHPMIGFFENWIIIVDGNLLFLLDSESDEEHTFELKEK